MIIPKNGDRSWSKEMWKYLQRLERCTNRIIGVKRDKWVMDSIIFGTAFFEFTNDDKQAISDLMAGKRP